MTKPRVVMQMEQAADKFSSIQLVSLKFNLEKFQSKFSGFFFEDKTEDFFFLLVGVVLDLHIH